jgi:hypothetical protein
MAPTHGRATEVGFPPPEALAAEIEREEWLFPLARPPRPDIATTKRTSSRIRHRRKRKLQVWGIAAAWIDSINSLQRGV